MKIISIVPLPLFILSLLYLIIAQNFFSPSPYVITVQVMGVLLGIWARRSFSARQFNIGAEPKDGTLIRKGPYKFVRHPMYCMSLLLEWSAVISHWSVVNAAVGTLITIVILIRISYEEKLLRDKFPDYAEYAKSTKRIIPFVF